MSTSIKEHISVLRSMSDECINSSEPYQVPSSIAPGDMIPQGDIGLLVLKEPCVGDLVEWAGGDFQLAEGNTKGSRHTIPARFSDVVSVFRINDGDNLSDLSIVATEQFDLVHPEHADHIGYPPGCYRVRHQQNAQRERVLD